MCFPNFRCSPITWMSATFRCLGRSFRPNAISIRLLCSPLIFSYVACLSFFSSNSYWKRKSLVPTIKAENQHHSHHRKKQVPKYRQQKGNSTSTGCRLDAAACPAFPLWKRPAGTFSFMHSRFLFVVVPVLWCCLKHWLSENSAIALGGNTRLSSCEPLVIFSLTDQYITLLYVRFC